MRVSTILFSLFLLLVGAVLIVPSATPEHVIFAGTTPDFTMAAYPTSLSIDAGSSAISYVVLTSLNGFSGTVSLSQSSPSGLAASLSSSIVTLSSGGNASSVLTVSAASSTAPGIYSIIITGTGGGLSHSATVTVSVNQTSPDFSISASPMFLNIQPGTSGSSTIIITALNGFSGTVSLGVAPSQGLAVSLMPSSVVGSGTATLTVTAPSNGKYSATVTGISGSLSHAVTVYVTVGTSAAPDFAISASPANLAITAGSSASSTVTLTSLNGFNGTVYLTSQVSPGGLAATLSGVSVSLYPGGSGSSVLPFPRQPPHRQAPTLSLLRVQARLYLTRPLFRSWSGLRTSPTLPSPPSQLVRRLWRALPLPPLSL